MGGGEAERLVEPERVRASLVGGELHQPAAALACLADRPFDHRPAQPVATVRGRDPDSLDLRPQHAVPAQPWQEIQLQRPGELSFRLGHDEPAARVRLYLLERDQVRVIHVTLAFRAKHVIRKQGHDGRHILAPRVPEHHHQPRVPAYRDKTRVGYW
jgi:hypothetical protein